MPRRILEGTSEGQMKSSSSLLHSPVFFFFLGMLVVLVILLILILIFRKFLKPNTVVKLLRPTGTTQASADLLSENLHSISYFDFHTLKKATKNFNPANLLGLGGFGPVYLVWKLYERSALIELVDPKMKDDGYVEKNVVHVIQVALLCLQPHGDLRPAMSEIVAMLTYKFEIIQTPLKPAFLERRPKRNRDLSLTNHADTIPSPLQPHPTDPQKRKHSNPE
ncbi:Cysteine-rich receptor-like protein kinase 4, partial [Cucurbita argyrosperma subsp. argyrosperma]